MNRTPLSHLINRNPCPFTWASIRTRPWGGGGTHRVFLSVAANLEIRASPEKTDERGRGGSDTSFFNSWIIIQPQNRGGTFDIIPPPPWKYVAPIDPHVHLHPWLGWSRLAAGTFLSTFYSVLTFFTISPLEACQTDAYVGAMRVDALLGVHTYTLLKPALVYICRVVSSVWILIIKTRGALWCY